MKATKHPRETVSSLNYRDAEETPTTTHPDLAALTSFALDALKRDGKTVQHDGETAYQASYPSTTDDTHPLYIVCVGPDIPNGIPKETAHPSVIPYERPWVGVYRLIVKAPLVVLDLYWRPDEPLRIMGFSRGDWEGDLENITR